MQPTIEDVLSLLRIVMSYSVNGPASRKYVTKTFNDLPIRKASISDYSALEQLCVELGLLEVQGDSIGATTLGAEFSECSPTDRSFSDEFIRRAILGPGTGKRIRSALSAFHLDEYGVYSYPKKAVYDLFSFPAIMAILYETGLLEKDGSKITINPGYAELTPSRITQASLESRLARRNRIGSIGEKIAFEFEKTRLKELGCPHEASKVKVISAEFANAGYDMESFDMDRDGRMHEIYVEVKSSTGSKIDFYWSANELEKAKTHAERYWIYFVPGIDEQTGESSDEPIRIQNPYKTVFNNPSFKTEPSQYRTSGSSLPSA